MRLSYLPPFIIYIAAGVSETYLQSNLLTQCKDSLLPFGVF
jgi:hypothetical protein